MTLNPNAVAGQATASVIVQFLRRVNNLPPQVLAQIMGGIVEEWSLNYSVLLGQKERYLNYLKRLQDGEITIDDLTVSDDDVVEKTNKEPPSKRKKSENNGHNRTEAIPLPENIIAS